MKRKIIILSICSTALFSLCSMLLADEIHLKNNSVIQGKIIQVGKTNIEYDPAGEKPFAVISRTRVRMIKYNDGSTVPFSGDSADPEDSGELKINADNHTQEKVSMEEIQPEKQPRKGGFLESRIRIAGFAAALVNSSEIQNKEKELYNANKSNLNLAPGEEYSTSNDPFNLGGEVDIILFTGRFIQKRGFDLTGIQFGVKGGYLFYNSFQNIYEYDSNDSEYSSKISSGSLMEYHSWFAGPVFNLVFSPRSDTFNMMIQFYGVYGRVIDGSISAGAALRDANIVFDRSQYFSDIEKGYYIKAGVGPHFVLNKGFPLTIGLNFTQT
ncbi:MAG: hypothetical protein GY754_40280 [bacterium]|nr:hypothetical protein [bacterium]